MNELPEMLLTLIDLRINSQLNNSDFLRKYNGYVIDVIGEKVKVMMDFTQMDFDESQAYTFINKTGSTNIKRNDNVEILCNKDFSNGYVNKNFSVKQLCTTFNCKSTTVTANGIVVSFDYYNSTKTFAYDNIEDSIKNLIKDDAYTIPTDSKIKAFIEFRGNNVLEDDNAIITKLVCNINKK